MRKLLYLILFLLVLYFVFSRFTEVGQIVATFQRGDWKWLSLAFVVHAAWLLNLGASFRSVYRLLGIEERIERLVPLAAAAYFVNLVAPAAGMSGMAVLVADARKRGKPTSRVTVATALCVLYDYVGFLIVLGLGLIVLFRRSQLSMAEIFASMILVGIAAGLAFLLYLGMRSAEALGHALAQTARVINRLLHPFLRRDYLQTSRAYEFAQDAAEGLREARRSPEGLLLPAALALSSKALLITLLFLVFMAFRQPFSVGTLIAGFSIGYLFLIVSPTPSGIGFAEGAMTLALVSLRVPLAPAGVITLVYRGFTLWLTFLYGMVAFRWASRTAPAKVLGTENEIHPQEPG